MREEEKFLYQKLEREFGKRTIQNIELPEDITGNLNPKFQIREYQKEAFQRFICYYDNDFNFKNLPSHLLFNMATGSGKTLLMAGLMLYLYQQGYRNFLFYVHITNILDKTKDNFLNKNSSKYLFNKKIILNGREVNVNPLSNFNEAKEEDINIFFTTIQSLHNINELFKENATTYEDFEDQPVVLLGDEAHHNNQGTKKDQQDKKNWEETTDKILECSSKNILLEFTATIDWANPAIKEKYVGKTLSKYDLLHFRRDKFSKEIKTLTLDSDLDQVMLHAVLLSQYRLKIAEKNKISLKPVILFKAQKTIKQSEENEKRFKKLIEDLHIAHLERLFKINYSPDENTILVDAFSYLDEVYKGNYQNLIQELQQDFLDETILNVNDDKAKKDNQLLLNSLEDKNNPVRAIFAVNKLNEGWDVLNLFDIVRVYDSRDGDWNQDEYKAGKTTLSEAQLIGRGARYFPFTVNEEQDKFTRKYDEDVKNELKVLEELHYHTKYNSRYLDELEKTLVAEGLLDDKNKLRKETIRIKDTSDNSFYQTKEVFKNSWVVNENNDKKSFADYGVVNMFEHRFSTDEISETKIFLTENNQSKYNQVHHRINLIDLDKRIFFKAFNQNKDFWTFNNLKQYFGKLRSLDDLMSDKFFYSIEAKINQAKKNLSNQEKLDLVNALLFKVSQTIKQKTNYKKGTKTFYSYPIHQIFRKVKELKFKDSDSEIGVNEIKEHFLHDKLIGTSEEKNFIDFFEGYLAELKKKYREVRLLRNNRELKIYRFEDGEAFEPDFILFLTKKNGLEISYQVFIEPKGDHLLSYDEKKEKFLLQIADEYELDTLYEKEYKLIGLEFYNKKNEKIFLDNFKDNLFITKSEG